MQKRRIFINACMSTVQIVVITVTIFYLYRFLLQTLGVDALGIWSLVLASTSITQIANMGLSGGVVKFVAKYFALGELENLNGVVQTALWSLAAATGMLLIFAYPLCAYGLSWVIPASNLPTALAILPYALIAVWLLLTGSVIQSSLDGIQRNSLGSVSQVTGTLLNLVLCLLLVKKLGLMGLAWAKIIQNLFLIFINYIFLKRCLPSISFFPLKWEKRLFREMIGYGTSFQVMSLMSMLYDPVTKAILSKFGGLSLVGYYEMATRMINQLRSIIISANGVIVPVVAENQEKSPERVKHLYLASYQILIYIALPAYSLVIVSIPFISFIWIGIYEPMFVIFGTFLAFGGFLNTLNGPAFFTYLGTGELRWNLLAHIATAVLNPVLGVILGLKFGGVGVVIAWVVSLALGSSIIYLAFHLKNGIPLRELLPKSSRVSAVVCSLEVLSALIIQSQNSLAENPIPYLTILIGFFLLLSVSQWFHPIRRKLFTHLSEMLQKTAELPGARHP